MILCWWELLFQQNKLLGHVIRADRMDPMRLPTIDSNLNTPGVFTKRTGKPRLHWVKENCTWVYKFVFEKKMARGHGSRTGLYNRNSQGSNGRQILPELSCTFAIHSWNREGPPVLESIEA